MPTGSFFYLIFSFKVAVGNGFQDYLSQRAIRGIQVASLSLSFLAHRVTTFVQPLVRTVTTKISELLLPFLLFCQSRQAKICMSATLVLLEMRQASYKSHLQEWPCFFPNSTLLMFSLDSTVSFLSLHTLLIS